MSEQRKAVMEIRAEMLSHCSASSWSFSAPAKRIVKVGTMAKRIVKVRTMAKRIVKVGTMERGRRKKLFPSQF